MGSSTGMPWMVTAFAGVVALLGYFVHRMVQERRFYKNVPKPPHHWFWGHLKLMGEIMALLPKDTHYQWVVMAIAHKYNMPRVFYLDLWPVSWGQVIVSDPDLAMHVTGTKNFPKHEAEKIAIDPMIGASNIVTSDGPRWKHLHRMLSPAFSVQHISNMRPAIAEEIMEFRDILHTKAKSGEKFRFEDLTLHTTFDVIGKATFGQSLNAKREGSLALEHWENMSRAFASIRGSWNLIKNFFKKRLVRTEAKKLDAILAGIIRQRFDLVVRENTNLSSKKGLNIMDLILRESMDEIRQLNKQELDPIFLADAITQIKTLLVAGTGTTSNTICFTMMLLSVRPEVVRKLREEHDTVFTKGIDATYEMLRSEPHRLNRLDYTSNVIKEVLRFYSVGNTARAAHPTDKFLTYEGVKYPIEGKNMSPVHFCMHLNEEIFPNAKQFDPDRFERGDFPRHAWRPFERGPRGCLGQSLATDALKLMLLLTVREFDFTCADLKPNKTPRVEWFDWDLTFGDRAFQEYVFDSRPRDGVPMTVKQSDWKSW